MFNEVSEPVELDAFLDFPAKQAKGAAITAIETLREHGNMGVARNLEAGASLAALKAVLSHGELGPFVGNSSDFRRLIARLIKLNEVREHISSAQAWATTQKHRLAECQSAQNLIKLINDWLKRDGASKAQGYLEETSRPVFPDRAAQSD